MKNTFYSLHSHIVTALIASVGVLVITLIMPHGFVFAEKASNALPYPVELYAQCFDGKDNDGDGLVDLADKDCPRCADGLDNDNDGLVDEKDPDCPRAPQARRSMFRLFASAVLGIDSSPSQEPSGTPLTLTPRGLDWGGEVGGGSITTGADIGSPYGIVSYSDPVGGGRVSSGETLGGGSLGSSAQGIGGGSVGGGSSHGGAIPSGGTIPTGPGVGGGSIPSGGSIN